VTHRRLRRGLRRGRSPLRGRDQPGASSADSPVRAAAAARTPVPCGRWSGFAVGLGIACGTARIEPPVCCSMRSSRSSSPRANTSLSMARPSDSIGCRSPSTGRWRRAGCAKAGVMGSVLPRASLARLRTLPRRSERRASPGIELALRPLAPSAFGIDATSPVSRLRPVRTGRLRHKDVELLQPVVLTSLFSTPSPHRKNIESDCTATRGPAPGPFRASLSNPP